MADELDLGLEEEMALGEETAQEGTPVDPQEPHVQPMELAPEGPEDVAHGGPGEEEPEEAGLLGIAQGGLPVAVPVGPVELRPGESGDSTLRCLDYGSARGKEDICRCSGGTSYYKGTVLSTRLWLCV